MEDKKRIAELEQEVLALRKEAEMQKSFLENVQDVFYCTDFNTGIILDMGPSIKYFSEFNKEELIGTPAQDLYYDPNERAALLTEVSKSGELNDYEIRLKTKTTFRYVSINARLIHVDGKPDHIDGSIRDITRRKEAEIMLRAKNEELIKINTEKDKLFSIIAHDLRGPFNPILGFTEMMAEGQISIDDMQKIAFMVNKSAKSLFQLLENLLEWARMQRGLVQYEPVNVFFAQKIKGIVEPLLGLSKQKEIMIDYVFPVELEFVADFHMLEVIIRNLISNAIKFTPKGGRIIISGKKNDDGWVLISIKDSGIGMNSEILSKLFEIDSSLGRNRKGTDGENSSGLGLNLCHDFIEKHGGKLWAESEEGKGSTFYFTLPGF